MFGELVRSRRTSMVVDRQRDVSNAIVEQLCELAQWAPNHKRTWPSRYALVEGDGRARLGAVVAEALAVAGGAAEKVAATRTKYLRTPAILIVGSTPGDTPLRSAENRDSTAAGIQNALLGATAAGLASYWSSCPPGTNDAVASFCDFDAGTTVLALIYLGWPTSIVDPPSRPPVRLKIIER